MRININMVDWNDLENDITNIVGSSPDWESRSVLPTGNNVIINGKSIINKDLVTLPGANRYFFTPVQEPLFVVTTQYFETSKRKGVGTVTRCLVKYYFRCFKFKGDLPARSQSKFLLLDCSETYDETKKNPTYFLPLALHSMFQNKVNPLTIQIKNERDVFDFISNVQTLSSCEFFHNKKGSSGGQYSCDVLSGLKSGLRHIDLWVSGLNSLCWQTDMSSASRQIMDSTLPQLAVYKLFAAWSRIYCHPWKLTANLLNPYTP